MVATRKLGFSFMTFVFRIRDFFKPPRSILENSGVSAGMQVLDYGCGPGSFSVAAAQLVGVTGKVFAADMNPQAIQMVQKKTRNHGLGNIETIITGCKTSISNQSIDFVLFLDTLHFIANPPELLQEFHRVLKADGFLLFGDHHLGQAGNDIITKTGLFKLKKQIPKLATFVKV
jgi:ubiquinone/menaquinone biosynthesis C-methylase UbiE